MQGEQQLATQPADNGGACVGHGSRSRSIAATLRDCLAALQQVSSSAATTTCTTPGTGGEEPGGRSGGGAELGGGDSGGGVGFDASGWVARNAWALLHEAHASSMTLSSGDRKVVVSELASRLSEWPRVVRALLLPASSSEAGIGNGPEGDLAQGGLALFLEALAGCSGEAQAAAYAALSHLVAALPEGGQQPQQRYAAGLHVLAQHLEEQLSSLARRLDALLEGDAAAAAAIAASSSSSSSAWSALMQGSLTGLPLQLQLSRLVLMQQLNPATQSVVAAEAASPAKAATATAAAACRISGGEPLPLPKSRRSSRQSSAAVTTLVASSSCSGATRLSPSFNTAAPTTALSVVGAAAAAATDSADSPAVSVVPCCVREAPLGRQQQQHQQKARTPQLQADLAAMGRAFEAACCALLRCVMQPAAIGLLLRLLPAASPVAASIPGAEGAVAAAAAKVVEAAVTAEAAAAEANDGDARQQWKLAEGEMGEEEAIAHQAGQRQQHRQQQVQDAVKAEEGGGAGSGRQRCPREALVEVVAALQVVEMLMDLLLRGGHQAERIMRLLAVHRSAQAASAPPTTATRAPGATCTPAPRRADLRGNSYEEKEGRHQGGGLAEPLAWLACMHMELGGCVSLADRAGLLQTGGGFNGSGHGSVVGAGSSNCGISPQQQQMSLGGAAVLLRVLLDEVQHSSMKQGQGGGTGGGGRGQRRQHKWWEVGNTPNAASAAGVSVDSFGAPAGTAAAAVSASPTCTPLRPLLSPGVAAYLLALAGRAVVQAARDRQRQQQQQEGRRCQQAEEEGKGVLDAMRGVASGAAALFREGMKGWEEGMRVPSSMGGPQLQVPLALGSPLEGLLQQLLAQSERQEQQQEQQEEAGKKQQQQRRWPSESDGATAAAGSGAATSAELASGRKRQRTNEEGAGAKALLGLASSLPRTAAAPAAAAGASGRAGESAAPDTFATAAAAPTSATPREQLQQAGSLQQQPQRQQPNPERGNDKRRRIMPQAIAAPGALAENIPHQQQQQQQQQQSACRSRGLLLRRKVTPAAAGNSLGGSSGLAPVAPGVVTGVGAELGGAGLSWWQHDEGWEEYIQEKERMVEDLLQDRVEEYDPDERAHVSARRISPRLAPTVAAGPAPRLPPGQQPSSDVRSQLLAGAATAAAVGTEPDAATLPWQLLAGSSLRVLHHCLAACSAEADATVADGSECAGGRRHHHHHQQQHVRQQQASAGVQACLWAAFSEAQRTTEAFRVLQVVMPSSGTNIWFAIRKGLKQHPVGAVVLCMARSMHSALQQPAHSPPCKELVVGHMALMHLLLPWAETEMRVATDNAARSSRVLPPLQLACSLMGMALESGGPARLLAALLPADSLSHLLRLLLAPCVTRDRVLLLAAMLHSALDEFVLGGSGNSGGVDEDPAWLADAPVVPHACWAPRLGPWQQRALLASAMAGLRSAIAAARLQPLVPPKTNTGPSAAVAGLDRGGGGGSTGGGSGEQAATPAAEDVAAQVDAGGLMDERSSAALYDSLMLCMDVAGSGEELEGVPLASFMRRLLGLADGALRLAAASASALSSIVEAASHETEEAERAAAAAAVAAAQVAAGDAAAAAGPQGMTEDTNGPQQQQQQQLVNNNVVHGSKSPRNLKRGSSRSATNGGCGGREHSLQQRGEQVKLLGEGIIIGGDGGGGEEASPKRQPLPWEEEQQGGGGGSSSSGGGGGWDERTIRAHVAMAAGGYRLAASMLALLGALQDGGDGQQAADAQGSAGNWGGPRPLAQPVAKVLRGIGPGLEEELRLLLLTRSELMRMARAAGRQHPVAVAVQHAMAGADSESSFKEEGERDGFQTEEEEGHLQRRTGSTGWAADGGLDSTEEEGGSGARDKKKRKKKDVVRRRGGSSNPFVAAALAEMRRRQGSAPGAGAGGYEDDDGDAYADLDDFIVCKPGRDYGQLFKKEFCYSCDE